MADGSVEIKISGSVDPSLAASANTAKASLTGIGDSASISAKSMAAALAAAGGNLKAITPEMLGLAAATQTEAAASGEKVAAEVVDTVATKANTAATINSRAAYESLVLVHEALQGRFSRMAGSSMILTQQLAGQAAVSNAVAFATSGVGIAVLGTVAAIGLITAATISAEAEEKKLTATAVGLGAQSGITAAELKKIGESADISSQSIRETTRAAEAFAVAGVRSVEVNKQLSNSVEVYAQLIGVKFAEAQKQLAAAMQDPLKGAKDLHEQLGILSGDQLEQIQRLVELGDKEQAQAIIVQAWTQRMDEAKQAGVGLRGEFGQLIDVLSNVYNWIGQVSEGFGREAETLLEDLIPALHQAGQAHRDAAAAASEQAQNEAALNKITGKGADLWAATPEGEAAKRRQELLGDVKAAKDAYTVDSKTLGENAGVTKLAKQTLDDYSHALNTFLSPMDKKLKSDQLDVQLAAAKHSHNKQLVADLTEQKAALEEAGKVESSEYAAAQARSKGDVAGARTFAPKGGKGPSVVSEWEEQLHAAEVASGEFFKDQTEKELQFWQGKVGQVRKGSKEWLEVQSKIYEAQKSLAHQSYDEHLADLNDSLEADRDNWAKEKKDWDTKLQYIADHFTKESKEYKDAHREFEAAEREHQQQMLQAQRDGEQKQLEGLKSHLAAENQLRNENARTTEALIKDQSDSSILGEIAAASRIGQLHAQLAQQEIADAETAYQAEDALREAEIARAEAAYTQDSRQYKDAVAAKALADQQYYDRKRQLEAQSYAQQIQDILAVKNAYSNYISGTVGATITGIDGMLSKTENWRQAVIGVYQSVVSTFENALGRMVTKWVVEHVFMTSAQRAQLAIQNAAQATSEATKTAVTTTGVATRAGVENTGFFAKILGLLGINLGAHTGTEAAKTAATATGAATRAAAEDTAAATSAATQIATNVTTALSYAAVAGAAGTASWAAAPWPIDAGAPAFGASMYADAASYAALASLDVGTNYMPRDQVVQAHEGERVIPKADNTKLIQMMAMASGGIDGGGRADVHLHYQPNIHERERLDMRQLLASGGGDMLSYLRQAVRDGKLKLAV